MNVKRTATTLILRVLALMLVAYAVPGAARADAPANGATGGGDLDVNPGYAAFQREMYFQRFPAAREGGPTEMGGHDKIVDKKSIGPGTINQGKSGPVFSWPVMIPTATSPVPTKRDEMINDDMFQTFGYPVSDTQLQVIQRYNQNRLLEQAFDPEKIMWASTATAGMQATSAANGAASAAVNQSQSAIDFTKKYLTNFTSEAGNRWQKIRDQLFIPMAILLLLPGAVLAQVKAIVSQGSPVLGDTNPFEGILRSIIAVFLIPATFLVINYGIDVSNSITFTIADEYKRIFGTDMYEDAQCAQKRAFPVNPADRNDNAMVKGENPPTSTGTDAWSPYEALTLNLRQYDPCAKIDKTRTPDERVRDAKKITRLMMNGANVGLTGTWNVMCAFQMAFLYYLWCMGPIAAALWVWPLGKLRGALPSWIEGVVTLCFWSLFWNTTVLLMACFRGVGDSGTVIMSALNFLANVCVKYAFDFSGLVSQGASSGVANAVQSAMQGGGAAAAGGGRGGAAGAPGSSAHGAAGTSAAPTGHGPTSAAGLSSALRTATAQNMHSGVGGFNTGSSVPGLTGTHGMPLANSLSTSAGGPLAGSHGPSGPTSATGVGRDAGLPPGATTGANFLNSTGGSPVGGTNHSGMSLASFNPGAHGGSPPVSFASTASFPGAGASNHLSSNSALSAGANSLGLHMNNGHLQVNPNAMHNLQQQMHDPNSAAHRELATAMNALQHGDPRALQALAQQGTNGIAGLDPQTSRALGSLAMDVQNAAQHGGLSQSDMGALAAFSSGQLVNGQPALGFSPDGTLTNNMTGAPVDFSRVSNLDSLGSNSVLNASGNPLSANYDPATGQSLTQSGITYDPTTGQPTNQTFAQMMADGSVHALPTNGLDGMAHTVGSDMPKLVDANGQPLPPNAVDAQGHFAPGFTPTGDVYALNSNTGDAMARFDTATNQWQATNAQGQPNGITMSANGDWTAPTANGGSVPVSYDNGTQNWYASNAAGNVMYDQSTGQLTTPQGTQLNYDGNTYTAANDSQIRYNQDQNSFVSTTTGAPLQNGSDGNWYASGTNGSVALNTTDNNLYMAGSNPSAATQVQYSASNDTYSTAGGQVYFDNARGSFEVAGSGAPVSYSNGTWYASDTNNQVAYNTSSHQMEAAGSNAGLVYNQNTSSYSTPDGSISYNSSTGTFQAGGQSVTAAGDQWYASNSNYTVAYDQQNQRFEAAGTTQPLTYGQTESGGSGWTAAGTNGAVTYDTTTGTYSAAGTQAPVYYSQGSGDSGTFYASGTNGNVYYDNSAQTWAGSSSGGGAVAYNYDNSTSSWSPAGGGGGGADYSGGAGGTGGTSGAGVYQIDASQQFANTQNAHQQVSQHEYSAQQQFAQYAHQQQIDQQQNNQQQYSQQFATEQRQLENQYQQTYAHQQYAAQQQQADQNTYTAQQSQSQYYSSQSTDSQSQYYSNQSTDSQSQYYASGSQPVQQTYNDGGTSYANTSQSAQSDPGTYHTTTSQQSQSAQSDPGTYYANTSQQSQPAQSDSGTYYASGSQPAPTQYNDGGTYYANTTQQSQPAQSDTSLYYTSSPQQSQPTQSDPGTYYASNPQQSQPTQSDPGSYYASNPQQSQPVQSDPGTYYASGSQQSQPVQSDPGTYYASGSQQSQPVQSDPGTYYASGSQQTQSAQPDPGTYYASSSQPAPQTDPGTTFQQTYANNVSFDQTNSGYEARTETASSYGQSYGDVVQPQYLASNAADQGATYEAAPQHHEQGHEQHHQEFGYQGHNEVANEPSSSANYYKPVQPQIQPQAQRPTGGLNAFVPVPAPRMKGPQPQAKPAHPQGKPPESSSEQPPEQPVHRKGPLDMNAKQGGYVTDDEKRKRQQELLKESWAEYQETQNPEEEA